MSLLQFSVHADYEEVVRLRSEIEKLENTLKNFGPGTTESTIKSIQSQLIEARKRFSELMQEAAKAGATVEQSIRDAVQKKTKEKGNINITVKTDTSDFHKKNERLIRDVDKSLRELEAYGSKASSTLQSVSQMAGLTLAGMGFVEFADKIKEVRGQFQQYEVAFKTMLGSAEKAQDLMQQLTQTAAITPFDLQGVTQGAKQLLAYGISADEVNQKLIQLGDIAAGLSLPLSDLVYLYGTTIAQGRMFTQDLRQFMGRGIPLAAELAKQFGVAESKVGELVTAGKVTAKEFNAAIESMSAAGGQFGGLMEAQSQTILGQISNIGDAIDSMFNDLGKSSEGVINATLSGVSYMVEHYEQFGRMLMGVVATYGTYKTTLMLVTAAKGWATAAEALHYNWLLLVEKAQKMLNATMLNNPYVLVATLIAGVAAAMVSMKTEAERIKEAEEEYEAQLQKTIDAEDEHRRKMEELCSVAGDEALSTDTRREALNELEKKYPDIFAKYDTEYEKLKNIKKIKEEIAELDGAKSIRQTKNELSSVNSRIDELEQKKATQHNELRFGKLRRVGGLTKKEKAELANLYSRRTELQKKSSKDDADKYIRDAASISDSMLEAEIKARRDLIAKLKLSGGTSGHISGGGASGDYSLDELQYQLNKLTDEQNRRNAKKDSSADWGKAAKDKYDKALKAYNDFVNNKTNSLSQEEYERKAQELKDALEAAKKEYEKYKPATTKKGNGGKKDDPLQRAYDLKKMMAVEDKRRDKMERDRIQSETDLRIKMMQDGTEKEIEKIRQDAKKKRDALDDELKKEIERLKKHDQDVWVSSVKGRKSSQWKQQKSDDEYLQTAVQNLGVATSLKEIAYRESKSMRDAFKQQAESMIEYLKEYGSFEQQKLAITKEYESRIANAKYEYEKLIIKKQRDKALADVESQAIMRKIDWVSVFDNVGLIFRSQIEPIYRDLQRYVQTDKFRSLNASDQKAIVEAMGRMRSQLGDKQGWRELASAITDYQDAFDAQSKVLAENNNIAIENARLINEQEQAQEKLEEITKSGNKERIDAAKAEFDVASAAVKAYSKIVEESDSAVEKARIRVSNAGTNLSSTVANIENPMANTANLLNIAGIGQISSLVNAFGQLQGNIDKLKAINEVAKNAKNASESLGDISDKSQTVGNVISDVSEDVIGSAQNVADCLDGASESIVSATEGIAESISNVADGVGESAEETSGNVKKAAKLLGKEVGDDLKNGLEDAGAIAGIIGAVISILDILKDGVGTLISSLIDTVCNAVIGILQNLLSGDFVKQIGGSLLAGVGGILDTLSFGGLSSIFGGKDSDKNLIRDIDRLTSVNNSLRDAVEKLTEEMHDAPIVDTLEKYNKAMENLGVITESIQEMMSRSAAAYKSSNIFGNGGHKSGNSKIDKEFNSKYTLFGGEVIYRNSEQWRRISDIVGKEIREASDFWNLTPDEMAKIKYGAPDLWARIKTLAASGYRDAEQFMEDYVALADEASDIMDGLKEILTDISLDSVKNEFKSLLLDMESDSRKFSDNFEKMLQKTVVSGLMKDNFNEELEKWYKDLYEAVKSGNKLTSSEVKALKVEYQDISEKALSMRDDIFEAMGWDVSSTQQSTTRSLEGMSQDTADALEGRMTAMQIAVESIRATHQIEAANVTQLTDAMLQRVQSEASSSIFYENLERQVAKIYLEVQGINENTGAMVRPIQNIENATNEMLRKIKTL